MKLKNTIAILIMMVAGLQTMKSQKIILHMSDNQKVEYEISQLDSITIDDEVYLTCPDDHHPHAIDLGLPSGTKWCCCNVEASTPEEYGGYYSWGETSERSVYNWATNKYFIFDEETGKNLGFTKYCTKSSNGFHGFTDGKTELDLIDDVAHARMGEPWRMPSTAQIEELINKCSCMWTQQNGVNGILVIGQNRGQIFLPAAGNRWTDDLYDAGSHGTYWSSSLVPDNDFKACALSFSRDLYHTMECDRVSAISVRAVCP